MNRRRFIGILLAAPLAIQAASRSAATCILDVISTSPDPNLMNLTATWYSGAHLDQLRDKFDFSSMEGSIPQRSGNTISFYRYEAIQ